MSQNGSVHNGGGGILHNEERIELAEEEDVEVMIQSLHLKVEELTGQMKSVTVVASKAVLEEQTAKDCSKLTA
jgi:hypothetical protein